MLVGVARPKFSNSQRDFALAPTRAMHLTAANAAAALFVLKHRLADSLAQIRHLAAGYDVGGRDVAIDPIDAAILGNMRLALGDEVD